MLRGEGVEMPRGLPDLCHPRVTTNAEASSLSLVT